MSGTEEKYPEILTDLRAKFEELLARDVPEKAGEISFRLTEIIRRDWSGQGVYIPKGQAYELSKRDFEIYQKFNGRNRHQLCREFDITEQWFYRIIKAVREAEIEKSQGKLF